MDPVILIALAVSLCLVMTLAWVAQQMTGKSGWVDAIWSFGVGAGGVAAVLLPGGGAPERRWLAGALVAIWALRLGLHIAKRTQVGEDDPRYEKLMTEWGKDAARNLFLFLQIQAACAFVLVLAVRLGATNPAPFPRVLDIIGAGLLIIALIGEAVADAQLAKFGREHKGQVCDIGLWRWSRHPNYFFEWLGWVGWALLALTANPWSWLALGAPALMYGLLVYASGIPPLEAHMLATRGEKFHAYQSRTSAFFPMPPKKEKS